jgi:hypothetical protein
MFLSAATTTTAAAASAVLPGFVAKAFAQDDADNGRDRAAELATLSNAYRTAQQTGRPLLVLVVPEDGGLRWERAHGIGELLNHGSAAVFADLALAEVVCSTMTTLRRLVPQAGDGEPWMVVVETDRHPASAQQLTREIEAWPDHWTHDGGPEELARLSNEAIDRRIADLGALVHAGLAADDAMITRRARAAEAHLDSAFVEAVHRAGRTGHVTPEMLSRAPAVVRASARGSESIQTDLAAHARQRLTQAPPAGSEWAHSWGCGITVEGRDDNMIVGCGMGQVPERSQRFLYWYTR